MKWKLCETLFFNYNCVSILSFKPYTLGRPVYKRTSSKYHFYFVAQDKVALVIATGRYQMRHKPLPASKFDGREMSRILTELGFKVSLKRSITIKFLCYFG